MTRLRSVLYAGMLAAAAGPAAGQADAEQDAAADAASGDFLDRTPETCISLPRVRDTAVMDDETIIFRMRGGHSYVNVLDRRCAGLENAGRFITNTRGTRLCRADIIQTFDQIGTGVFPGRYCALGDFHPVTHDEAEMLELEPREQAAFRQSVVLSPLEPDEIDSSGEETSEE